MMFVLRDVTNYLSITGSGWKEYIPIHPWTPLGMWLRFKMLFASEE